MEGRCADNCVMEPTGAELFCMPPLYVFQCKKCKREENWTTQKRRMWLEAREKRYTWLEERVVQLEKELAKALNPSK